MRPAAASRKVTPYMAIGSFFHYYVGLMLIASLQNPRIKAVARFRRRTHREDGHAMIIEGYREVKRALENRHFPTEIFHCPALYQGENESALVDRCRAAGACLIECTPEVFAKIAYRERPEGVLAVAPALRPILADLKLPSDPLLVAVEAIEKPGNLGTILRSADAAGVHGVIVCDKCTDINNPNVVRASIGTLFSVPLAEADSTAAIDWLKGRGIKIIAATPHATEDYYGVDLRTGIAFALGTEQYGLSPRWMEAADLKVRIPMAGQADSLNVAAAATILMFEAVRQRRAGQKKE